jgi:hypothetical protein
MHIKATIDDKEVELSPEQLQFGEGYGLITPDKVPSGYYNESTVQDMIKERLKNTKDKTRQELESDEDFQKRVLSRYNISLGEDGKPKGLKPTKDVDEIRKELAGELSAEYEGKINEFKQKLSKRDEAVIESAILSTVNGNYQEYLTKSFDGEKPLAVQKFKDRFGVDESGNVFVKNEAGEKMYKGDGLMKPSDYLLDEAKFGDFMADKRQRGSNFGNGSTGASAPSGDPSKWDLKTKLSFIEKNGKSGYEKALKSYKKD